MGRLKSAQRARSYISVPRAQRNNFELFRNTYLQAGIHLSLYIETSIMKTKLNLPLKLQVFIFIKMKDECEYERKII